MFKIAVNIPVRLFNMLNLDVCKSLASYLLAEICFCNRKIHSYSNSIVFVLSSVKEELVETSYIRVCQDDQV